VDRCSTTSARRNSRAPRRLGSSDRDAAATRLADGARVAATFGLPRLRAHLDNERMRLELPVAESTGQVEQNDALSDGELGEITAQLRDETEILGLLGNQPDIACDRTQAWVHRLEPQGRPRALLRANRVLVACLSAAGRTDEAKQTLANIAAQCADRRMVRYLLDGGPLVVALLAVLRDDLNTGRWGPTWPVVPSAFLDTIVSEAHSVSSDTNVQP
jgi:serine/threonine-protein kinase PknK